MKLINKDGALVTANFFEKKLTKVQQHEAGHKLLKETLEKYYGITSCEPAYEESGKPYLLMHPDIYISISNCMTGVVVGAANSPVGVDIEIIRQYPPKIISRVLDEDELLYFQNFCGDKNRLFFRLWTLKESYMKLTGDGLKFGAKNIGFKLPEFICKIENTESKSFEFENKFIISYVKKA